MRPEAPRPFAWRPLTAWPAAWRPAAARAGLVATRAALRARSFARALRRRATLALRGDAAARMQLLLRPRAVTLARTGSPQRPVHLHLRPVLQVFAPSPAARAAPWQAPAGRSPGDTPRGADTRVLPLPVRLRETVREHVKLATRVERLVPAPANWRYATRSSSPREAVSEGA
jgi:hypothetical protein